MTVRITHVAIGDIVVKMENSIVVTEEPTSHVIYRGNELYRLRTYIERVSRAICTTLELVDGEEGLKPVEDYQCRYEITPSPRSL